MDCLRGHLGSRLADPDPVLSLALLLNRHTHCCNQGFHRLLLACVAVAIACLLLACVFAASLAKSKEVPAELRSSQTAGSPGVPSSPSSTLRLARCVLEP